MATWSKLKKVVHNLHHISEEFCKNNFCHFVIVNMLKRPSKETQVSKIYLVKFAIF